MDKYYNHATCQEYEEIQDEDKLSIEELIQQTDYPNNHIKITNENVKIFVPIEDIVNNDEYEEGDSYIVNIDSPFHRRRIDMTLKIIRRIASEREGKIKILDAGCGKGYISDKIANENQRFEVSGCDYSYKAIQYANQKFSKVDFCVADLHNLPYKEYYFDVIVLNNIFEHIPDIVKVINEISSVLKVNGYMIISTPSRYRIDNIWRRLNHCEFKLKSAMHITEYSLGQVKELMEYNGYELIECSTYKLKEKDIKLRILKRMLTLFTGSWINPVQWESTVFFLFKKLK